MENVNGNPMKKLVLRIVFTAAVISLIAMLTLLVTTNFHLMLSFAFGFAASSLSFSILATSVYFVFAGGRKKAFFWGSVGIIKLFAVGMLLWYLVTRQMIEPISFLGGFSTVVFSLFIESIRLNMSTKKAI